METPTGKGVEALRQFVIQRRGELGLSQRDLAKRADISHGVIATLEAGQAQSIPRQRNLERLALGLGVTYERLDKLARGVQVDQAEPTAAEAARMSDMLRRWGALPADEQIDVLGDWEALLDRREQKASRQRLTKDRGTTKP